MTKSKKSETAPRPEVRHQVAALPFRVATDGAAEILVITSRDTGRFIIPKGWKKKGHKKPDAAATEAYEEAGVTGEVQRDPIGSYRYWKRSDLDFELLEVFVYPLRVTAQRMDWPEKGQRKMAWLPAEDAALLVSEPQLATIIRSFAENFSRRPTLAGNCGDI